MFLRKGNVPHVRCPVRLDVQLIVFADAALLEQDAPKLLDKSQYLILAPIRLHFIAGYQNK
jgi:hypothetical protein